MTTICKGGQLSAQDGHENINKTGADGVDLHGPSREIARHHRAVHLRVFRKAVRLSLVASCPSLCDTQSPDSISALASGIPVAIRSVRRPIHKRLWSDVRLGYI